MKKLNVAAAFVAAVLAVLTVPAQATVIPNQYIVVLNKAPAGDLLAGLEVAEQAEALLATVGGGIVLNTYQHALRGFAVRMSPAQAELLALNPLVDFISPDQIVRANATQNSATWGLDRSDQRNLPLNTQYTYPDAAGQGIHIYVLDTGLYAAHPDFTGRIGTGRNFADRKSASIGGTGFGGTGSATITPTDTSDCNGHGTHVAGTTAGTTWGIAKKATVHAVRVLNCGGEGQTSWIVAGIDWVTANAVRPAVANMSLGGGNNDAFDTAIRNSIASGITYAVAAGNDNADACTGSPNRVAEAITVGSTQNNDARSSFSNYGTCVDLFAPGTDITSAHWQNTGSRLESGTSMASPHVAGAAALVLARNTSQTPAQVAQVLVAESTTGVITSAGTGSPNRLMYVTTVAGPPPANTAPTAAFTYSCNGLSCSFNGTTSSDDSGIASYSWNFGDSTGGSGATVTRNYAAAGTYSVTLTVTDTGGLSDGETKSVAVSTGPAAPCTGCTKYSGTLASGAQTCHPNANGFTSAGGTIKGYLRGPAGADFDLFLEKQGTNILGQVTWTSVASGETNSNNEDVTYSAASGTYRWRVKSYSGAGAYDFWGQPK